MYSQRGRVVQNRRTGAGERGGCRCCSWYSFPFSFPAIHSFSQITRLLFSLGLFSRRPYYLRAWQRVTTFRLPSRRNVPTAYSQRPSSVKQRRSTSSRHFSPPLMVLLCITESGEQIRKTGATGSINILYSKDKSDLKFLRGLLVVLQSRYTQVSLARLQQRDI